MNHIDSAFHARLLAKIDERRQQTLARLETGAASLELYKRDAGYLAGLKDVVALADEIAHDMNQGDQ